MTATDLTRRSFLKGSLAGSLTLAHTSRAFSANDRISVGLIGCGRRNLLGEVIELRDKANVEILGVCDAWNLKREKAAQRVSEATGKRPLETSRYQDLLVRDDLDAVLIATPDHQHCAILIDAIQAGKHVYVEKPLAMNMEELNRAVAVVKGSDRTVQMGTQMRSYRQSQGSKQLIASGRLGKILKVEQARNAYSPYWKSYGGEDFFSQTPRERDVDWDAFLMNLDDRPFDPDRYQNWYGYREYSGGPQTNLMVHFIDLVHFITDVAYPRRVVAMGGVYCCEDQYTVPDSVEVMMEYAEGFMAHYSTIFGTGATNFAKWYGTRGTLDAKSLSSSREWMVSGEGLKNEVRISDDFQVQEPDTPHHMANWFDCIRSGQQPVAPIEAGYGHSVAVLMADKALMGGRRVEFDSKNGAIQIL